MEAMRLIWYCVGCLEEAKKTIYIVGIYERGGFAV